ncbi:hypothetical protein FNH13_17640 [Ornithinimicrobium ciconiae]|uniref:Uncharacterized protein n=1 Tax=Ornithinimicrobium ciconiae TaxID=2594265 RepID=A0A516GEG7_9MICO|nr:hypothetical protein [Ornithinimicrobium ciconiae]QDO89924.1 hypothetical protein FNH13_17640 [Ornithinimicrobium ciconiae]
MTIAALTLAAAVLFTGAVADTTEPAPVATGQAIPDELAGVLIEGSAVDKHTGLTVLEGRRVTCPGEHDPAPTELQELVVTYSIVAQPAWADHTAPSVPFSRGEVLPGLLCNDVQRTSMLWKDETPYTRVSAVLSITESDTRALAEVTGITGTTTTAPTSIGGTEIVLYSAPGDRGEVLAKLPVGAKLAAVGHPVQGIGDSSLWGSGSSYVPVVTSNRGLVGWLDSRAIITANLDPDSLWGELETVTLTAQRPVPTAVPNLRIDPAAVTPPYNGVGTLSGGEIETGTEVVVSVDRWAVNRLGWAALASSPRFGTPPPSLEHMKDLTLIVECPSRPGILCWAPAWAFEESAAQQTVDDEAERTEALTTEDETVPTVTEPGVATGPGREVCNMDGVCFETAEQTDAEPGATATDKPRIRDRVKDWLDPKVDELAETSDRFAEAAPGKGEELADRLEGRLSDSPVGKFARAVAWGITLVLLVPGVALLWKSHGRARARLNGPTTTGRVLGAASRLTPLELLGLVPGLPVGTVLVAAAASVTPGGWRWAVAVAGGLLAAYVAGVSAAAAKGFEVSLLRPLREHVAVGLVSGTAIALLVGFTTTWPAAYVVGVAVTTGVACWMAARNGAATVQHTELDRDQEVTSHDQQLNADGHDDGV